MLKSTNNTEFLVPSDLSQVQKVSSGITQFLTPLSLSEALLFDIRLCVEEALINAMKYGNQFKKDKNVKVDVDFDVDKVRVSIEDEGKGFDVKKLKDCTQADNLLRESGRGVYLIHSLMDEVKYNEKGNRVVMVKNIKQSRRYHAG